jgi:hypothetical protein
MSIIQYYEITPAMIDKYLEIINTYENIIIIDKKTIEFYMNSEENNSIINEIKNRIKTYYQYINTLYKIIDDAYKSNTSTDEPYTPPESPPILELLNKLKIYKYTDYNNSLKDDMIMKELQLMLSILEYYYNNFDDYYKDNINYNINDIKELLNKKSYKFEEINDNDKREDCIYYTMELLKYLYKDLYRYVLDYEKNIENSNFIVNYQEKFCKTTKNMYNTKKNFNTTKLSK